MAVSWRWVRGPKFPNALSPGEVRHFSKSPRTGDKTLIVPFLFPYPLPGG